MFLFDVLNQGGWMMWVILTISVVGVAIALDRIYLLYLKSRINTSVFLKMVLNQVENKDYRAALESCAVDTKHPLPLVLKSGLAKANRREKEIERAMEEEMLRALPRLQRGVGMLGLMGNTATLLGLLGTIFGLIKAFSGVSAASAAARQQVLAEGISIAMFTTAFGLIVAIIILFLHQFINGRIEQILIELEEGATALLGSLASRMKDASSSK